MADSSDRPSRCRLPRQTRIRRHLEFERVLEGGTRLSDGHLTVWASPNALGITRLGLMVTRKHGGAVRRNRLKRLLREAFRLTRSGLPPGLDLICSPRAGADIGLAECMEALPRLAERLAKRVRRA